MYVDATALWRHNDRYTSQEEAFSACMVRISRMLPFEVSQLINSCLSYISYGDTHGESGSGPFV